MKNTLTPDALTFESLLAANASADRPDDFSLLEALADQRAGGYCTTLEFAGESTDKATGLPQLQWFFTLPTFTGGWDRDEDGPYRDSQDVTESVTVLVRPLMTLGEIADALTEAIKDIENNVFA